MAAEIIGWIAFSFASLMLAPQVIKLIRHRNVNGLSLYMYIFASINYALWVIYGFLLNSPQVYIANILAFIFSMIILASIVISKIKSTKLKNDIDEIIFADQEDD